MTYCTSESRFTQRQTTLLSRHCELSRNARNQRCGQLIFNLRRCVGHAFVTGNPCCRVEGRGRTQRRCPGCHPRAAHRCISGSIAVIGFTTIDREVIVTNHFWRQNWKSCGAAVSTFYVRGKLPLDWKA